MTKNQKSDFRKQSRKMFWDNFDERMVPKCGYCGVYVLRDVEPTHDQFATVDHLVPVSKGGTNSLSNLVLSCRACNLKKANRLMHKAFK